MNKVAKKSIIERFELHDLNNDTWSNPEEWSGDSEFGVCDLTGDEGMIEPMQVLNLNGDLVEFEVLSEVAYKLHGLAGAY